MLSTEQFRNLHSQLMTGGGFTVDPRTGAQPRSGIAVGLRGRESRVSAESTTPEVLQSYMMGQVGAFMRPERHLGAWASDSTAYLDVAKVIPEEPHGEHVAEAYRAMHVERQDAAYDIGRNREIRNPLAPYSDTPDEFGSSVKIVRR